MKKTPAKYDAPHVKRSGSSYRLTKIRGQIPYWVMLSIPLIFFALFRFWPMFGLAISFQDYKLGDPFISLESNCAGFKWFKYLFKNPHFGRLLRNTLCINLLSLLISFPIAVLFSLLLNEVRQKWLRQFSSNLSLMPHFISTVVIVAIMFNLFSIDNGIINDMIEKLGGERTNFMGESEWFRTMYIGSDIWQNTGFSAVVYTAAIAGIDPTLYEAAALDGSSRLKNIFYVTLPCILPTVITMFILKTGQMMTVGADKILLMYNPSMYETADVFSTYAYRAGLQNSKWSLSAAISLMNSVCNVILLVTANKISKKISETSLW